MILHELVYFIDLNISINTKNKYILVYLPTTIDLADLACFEFRKNLIARGKIFSSSAHSGSMGQILDYFRP